MSRMMLPDDEREIGEHRRASDDDDVLVVVAEQIAEGELDAVSGDEPGDVLLE